MAPPERRSSGSLQGSTTASPHPTRRSISEQGAGKDDGNEAVQERKLAWSKYEEALLFDVKRQQAAAIALMSEDKLHGEELEAAMHSLFQSLMAGAMRAGQELQECDVEGTRKQLKSQRIMYELKLETARTAGDVALNNQKTEMEHVFHTKLEKKVEQLSRSEGALRKNSVYV